MTNAGFKPFKSRAFIAALLASVATPAFAAGGDPTAHHMDAHIILRGRHENGQALVIPREYISHGFRSVARDVATERLGPRGREDARLALDRAARTHGPSHLDRLIEGQLDRDRRVRISHLRAPADRSPETTDALKTRVRELTRLGLAQEVSRGLFEFEPGWKQGLKAMELHLDIRKALVRARTQDLSRNADPARQMSKALRLGR